ncbi:MAG: carboxypeptidase-like regulatory domain-containing protein [Planctomycetota bacterium]
MGLSAWLGRIVHPVAMTPVLSVPQETGEQSSGELAATLDRDGVVRDSTREASDVTGEREGDPGLTVQVFDSSGEAVAMALVELETAEPGHPGERTSKEPLIDSRRTRVDGHALFDRWPTAPFRVVVTPEEEDGDRAPLLDAERAVDPTKMDQSVPLRIELSRAARIVGTLDCSDGSSPRSSGVDIFHIATRSWTNAAAVEDGRFTSQWMAPGDVIVYARNGTWTETDLRLRQRFTLAEGCSHGFHGTLEPALVLEGTTVDGLGRPAPGHTVLAAEIENPRNERSATSDEGGRFRIEGLHATDYAVGLLVSDEAKQQIRLQRGAAPTEAAPLVVRP